MYIHVICLVFDIIMEVMYSVMECEVVCDVVLGGDQSTK